VRRFLPAFIILALLLVPSCDELEWSTIIVTAQVAKTLDPESNTASVLVGKATIENLFHDDWMETPDPGDTVFWQEPFPARVTPVSNAQVTLGATAVGEKVPGVYFKAVMELGFLERYDLEIVFEDGRAIAAHGWLPDSFTVTRPGNGDTLASGAVTAIWTASDSAETYLVGITPADTASPAQGWAETVADTFRAVPAAAFEDTLGNLVPGEYILGVTAINGGWNKTGLDLFLSGGNVSGGSGVFGCAVYPRPVVFRVE